ncbi:Vacuolar protein sorting-associated protein 26, partial [Coemansia sp. RSA 788]
SLFGFGPVADVNIILNGEDERQLVEYRVGKDKREKAPLYFDGESISGKVIHVINLHIGKQLEHYGIKVQFIGCIEMFYDRGNHYEFVSLVQELVAPAELNSTAMYNFEFKNVEKQYESYQGINAKLRYFIQATVSKRVGAITQSKDIWVYSYRMPPEINSSIRMEIKHMELSIIRRETTGAAPNQYNESETITKFEIMDGAPVRGETIPIRLFLGGFDLTPTYRDVNKKFSTRYYLNLVLVDEENRRYFKQQEITLYRRNEGERGALEGDETELE